jgi:hypothetical protein
VLKQRASIASKSRNLLRARVYRQTALGNLGLVAATALRKL